MSSRAIKFRSWVEDHYEYNVPVNKNGKYSKCTSTGFALQYDPSYKEYGVEEYIGRSDSYGTGIYECSIVEFRGKEQAVVYYDSQSACFTADFKEFDYLGWNEIICDHIDDLEVVGNTHEGVEKLEQGT